MTKSDITTFHTPPTTKPKLTEPISPPPSLLNKLTDELIIETLIHLPIKQLTLCKSISPRFHSLISSPYFIHRYLTHNQPNNTSFALYYQSKPTSYNLTRPSLMRLDLASDSPVFASVGFSLSFINTYHENEQDSTLQYLASNNGLVLCCAPLLRPVVYYVCNPLTKRSVALPTPPSNAKMVYIGFVCVPQHLFDYDGNDNDNNKTSFKVVRIEVVRPESRRQLSDTLKLEIFCSVSGRWSEEYVMSGSSSGSSSDHELFNGWNYRCPSAVVCDGLLYWDTLSDLGVFTYDPYKGECRTVELPREVSKPVWAFKHCLGECLGRLRYANFSWDDSSYRVWELKGSGGGGEWLLLHKVHLDEMISMDESISKDCMVLLSPHPLNQDIVFFWCRSSCRIVEYDMGNRVLRLPCFIQEAKISSLLYPMFFPFVLPVWPTAVPVIQQQDVN